MQLEFGLQDASNFELLGVGWWQTHAARPKIPVPYFRVHLGEQVLNIVSISDPHFGPKYYQRICPNFPPMGPMRFKSFITNYNSSVIMRHSEFHQKDGDVPVCDV